MTVANRPLTKTVSGVTLNVPIAANIDAQSADDIKVLYAGGVAILDSDYTMSIASDFKSFTITPLAGLVAKADGGPVSIKFDPVIVQNWDIPASPRFPERELEAALDRLTLFVRTLADQNLATMQRTGDDNGDLPLDPDISWWDALNINIKNLRDGVDAQDAVTLGQVTALITSVVSGAFPNQASLISYVGDLDGATVALALDAAAALIEGLRTDVDDLTGGFLAGGLLTGALEYKAYIPIDSAATVDMGAVAGNRVQLNGTDTITSFGTGQNKFRIIYHNGIHQITAGGSLIPPGAADKVAAVGDISIWLSGNSATWRCLLWTNANGRPNNVLLADISNMSANARTFNAAADFAAMKTAMGLGTLASQDFSGLVYAGSSATNTSFPIGTIVVTDGGAASNTLGSTATIRINNSNDAKLVIGGAGAALAGTWRARGFSGEDSGDFYFLYQRTA